MSAIFSTRRIGLATAMLGLVPLFGCQSAEQKRAAEDIPTMSNVDLSRFGGAWYVIANIPTPLERNIFNAVEHYDIDLDNGRVETTFSFNKGSLTGPRKVYRPTAFVEPDGSNAVWGMQFLWPFRAEYRILYVDPTYSHTVIGRSKRDYLWVMSRDTELSEETMQSLLQVVAEAGYDENKLVYIGHDPAALAADQVADEAHPQSSAESSASTSS